MARARVRCQHASACLTHGKRASVKILFGVRPQHAREVLHAKCAELLSSLKDMSPRRVRVGQKVLAAGVLDWSPSGNHMGKLKPKSIRAPINFRPSPVDDKYLDELESLTGLSGAALLRYCMIRFAEHLRRRRDREKAVAA